jgi:hypothetical protein
MIYIIPPIIFIGSKRRFAELEAESARPKSFEMNRRCVVHSLLSSPSDHEQGVVCVFTDAFVVGQQCAEHGTALWI